MKILVVISSLQIGGEQRALNTLSDEFVKLGNNVDIYVLSPKVDKQFDFNPSINITYHSNSGAFKNIDRVRDIRKTIKNNAYDVVIGFAVIPSILCSLAGYRTKVPVVVCERNDPMIYRNALKTLRSIAYRLCTAGIFQTKDAADCFPYMKKKTVIPNPINRAIPDVYTGVREKSIVCTSRFTKAKNQDVLVEAFDRIHEKHADYILEMYGDGVEKDRLIENINNKGLADRILIHDAVPNILDIIRKKEVFVLPSKHEGYPNSLVEAMALGLACISTDCRIGGPKDIITDHNNGLLVTVDSVDELEQALDELLSNKELIKKFQNNSVRIRTRLKADIIAENWMNYIRSIL